MWLTAQKLSSTKKSQPQNSIRVPANSQSAGYKVLWSRNRDIIYEKMKYLLLVMHIKAKLLIRIIGLQVLYEKRNKAPHNKLQELFYWNTIGSCLQAQLPLGHQIKYNQFVIKYDTIFNSACLQKLKLKTMHNIKYIA